MARMLFKLNYEGVGQLLKSREMQNVLNAYASGMVSRAGSGYEAETFIGFDRAHVIVRAATPEAARENSENNTLLKAVR